MRRKVRGPSDHKSPKERDLLKATAPRSCCDVALCKAQSYARIPPPPPPRLTDKHRQYTHMCILVHARLPDYLITTPVPLHAHYISLFMPVYFYSTTPVPLHAQLLATNHTSAARGARQRAEHATVPECVERIHAHVYQHSRSHGLNDGVCHGQV
jgi:hypothetical protein